MTLPTISELQEAHKLLAEWHYHLQPVHRGYANRTLYINLSDKTIAEKPVTFKMKDTFTGGRGFGLWLLWNAVTPETRWDSPENEIIIAGGPIGGITAYPGSGKLTSVTLSPLTGCPIDSNAGGHFGPYLKFSGWDALEIQGKAEKDVVIYIDGDAGLVQIVEAPLEAIDTHLVINQMTELFARDTKDKSSIAVISAGQAADHVAICGLNSSYYDPHRDEVRIKQATRGGTGRVLRDKHIKAIVVHYSETSGDSNGVADLELIRSVGRTINKDIANLTAPRMICVTPARLT